MITIIGSIDRWGFIPDFLDETDPRPAREQLAERYIGGWNPFKGFAFDAATMTLRYEDDPVLLPESALLFRDETLLIYQSDWVLILQKDNSFEISRMD